MILGGLALLVDRFVLSDGPPASADGAVRQSDTSGPRVSTLAVATTLAIPEVPFPRSAAMPPTQSDLRDWFAPPSQPMASTGASTSTQRRGGSDNPQGLDSASFIGRHRLNGVIQNERLRIAVIDDQWMETGQMLDGCTLSVIDGTEVRFRCDDGEAVLHVTPDAPVPRR